MANRIICENCNGEGVVRVKEHSIEGITYSPCPVCRPEMKDMLIRFNAFLVETSESKEADRAATGLFQLMHRGLSGKLNRVLAIIEKYEKKLPASFLTEIRDTLREP